MTATWMQRPAVAPPLPLHEDGMPRYGTYEGACERTSLDAAAARIGMGPLWRLRSEKRWQWFGAIDPELALGGAIVRTGYVSQMFLWVFDRRRLEMLVDLSLPGPPSAAQVSDQPDEGVVARFELMGQRVELTRWPGRVEVRARVRGVELSLVLHEQKLSAMTAICPVPNDRVNLTQKQAGLLAEGVVRVGRRTLSLSPSAQGFLDYSHGLLAYETDWRWAIGAGHTPDGRRLSFNLVEGFNEGMENVAWLDGTLHSLGQVVFRYNPQAPWAPWFVRTPDDRVRLTLYVDGIRRADVKYGVVQSRYVQPIGRWAGHVGDWPIELAVGVAEDHRARW